MSDYSELWERFDKYGAERFETFTAWALGADLPGRLGAYYADRAAGSWWAEAFRTYKAMKERGISFMARPLTFPEARTVADLFEAARFIPTQGGGHYRDEGLRYIAEKCGAPGFLFCSGTRAAGMAPMRSIYARKEWAESGHRRHSGAGGFWATYAKPKPEVWKAWGSDEHDLGDFGLSGFEFVERSDGAGVLVIARPYCGIGDRWLAFLNPGESLLALMPAEDRAVIERDDFAERGAWGSYSQKPDGWRKWRVTGADRQPGALGNLEPFAPFEVGAVDHDGARQAAIDTRYAAGRDSVRLDSVELVVTPEEAAAARAKASEFFEPLREAARLGAPLAEVPKGARAIAPEVLEVLRNADTEGPALMLRGQLARPLYEATNAVLEALGGKWSRSKRAHLFEADAGDLLAEVLASGCYVDQKKVLQAFYTPPDLARRVIEAAAIEPGMKALEPSAGSGALLRPAIAAGASVWAYEIDPAAREKLVSDFFPQFGAGGCPCKDFLTVSPGDPGGGVFDRVIMNPPFSGGQDVRHVMHAARFVRPGGRLVAIMSPGFRYRQTEPFRSFRDWLEAKPHTIADIPAGAFAEAGTQIATVLVTVDL